MISKVEKLKIIAKSKKDPIKFKPIQLYRETHELIDEVAEISGEPKAAVAHKLIQFAYEHIEIINDDEE